MPEEATTPDLEERVQSSFAAINPGDFDAFMSGAPVARAIAIVWTRRDGLIWHGEVFLDQREALKAAGLEA
jgi:hypothetical protein